LAQSAAARAVRPRGSIFGYSNARAHIALAANIRAGDDGDALSQAWAIGVSFKDELPTGCAEPGYRREEYEK